MFSISAVQASDVNITDSNLQTVDDNNCLEMNNTTQFNDLNSLSSDNQLNDNSSDVYTKNLTELSSQSATVYYYGSYNVVLKDCDSNLGIGNKTVNFVINNIEFNVISDSNGIAGITLDLSPGNYVITSYFDGDEDYENSSLTDTVTIVSTIKANDITKYYKGSKQYSAQFFDSYGKVLANRAVTITVNGKSYNKKTNSYGIAYLSVNLKPGNYKIVATDPLTGYNLSSNFKILSTVSANGVKQVQGQNKKFTVKFFTSAGKALANKYVKIKFKGKVHKYKTNSKGIVTLSLKKFNKGTYKMLCYNRDGLSKTYTVKIYKKKASTKLSAQSYTFYPNSNKIIKVKLSTALGDNSNAGKIIKIKINGKTYSKKTDSNGIAYLNLSSFKKGIFSVEYKYGGNSFFKSSKSVKSVTIFNTNITSLTVKSTTHFGYGAGTSLKLAYTAGGVPLSGRHVKLSVAGVTYYTTTDSKGIVSIPVNLNTGDYTVYYKTNDESKFIGTSGSFDINVFNRTASRIIWKSASSFKDNSQIFKVLVTDSAGKPTSGGSIDLIIDGVTYTASVGSNGYAKVKTGVDIGGYEVSVKFNGNNNLLSGSTSKKINVKLSKFANGLNEKNAGSSSKYLKSSSHCKVGAKAIKKLVKSLTKGLTSKTDKAKAIFNYVRDTLSYSYYYNTKYGAVKTLKLKRGNCVDHSHLLVSMFRTAGFQARYVHGKCHFTSGTVTGHVWAQVKIGGNWVVCDAVSYRNSLGKVKNWNTKHYTIYNKYSSLPF